MMFGNIFIVSICSTILCPHVLGQPELLTTQISLCAPVQVSQDPSAQVTNPQDNIKYDNSSIVVYGANSKVSLATGASVTLKKQSSLRAMPSSEIRLAENAKIIADKSSHITAVRKIELKQDSLVELDGSQLISMGKFSLSKKAHFIITDQSFVLTTLGGLFEVGDDSRVQIIKSAAIQVGRNFVNVRTSDNYKTTIGIGPENFWGLFHRAEIILSSKASFYTADNVTVALEKHGQLDLDTNCLLNVTANSTVIIREGGWLKLKKNSSLVFDTKNIHLQIEPNLGLEVQQNAHCLLKGNLKVEEKKKKFELNDDEPTYKCYNSFEKMCDARTDRQ